MFDMPFDPAPVALQQSPEYLRALRAMGVQAEQIVLSSDGQVVGQAVMQARWWPILGWVGLISRGPVWVGAPDMAALTDALNAQGHPVLLNADGARASDLSKAGFFPVLSAGQIGILSLSGDAQDRRAAMHQKWRNRLNKAERGPLRVRRAKLPRDPSHWIYAQEAEQRQARGYRGLPGAVAAQFAVENPRRAHMFWAELGGDPVAGMAFLQHGTGVSYFLGYTSETGRAENAHTLLLAHAADWFSAQGCAQMDLGGIDTVNTPGLARFKLGSGAQAHALGGTWFYSRPTAAILRKRF